jgi:type II secretory pathway pseudopilin PulG
MRRLVRNERGFTLTELLVVLPMLVVLLGGFVVTMTTLMRVSDRTQEAATLQTEARAAITSLAADVRGAFVGDGSSPVVSADGTSITFYSPDRSPTTVSGSTATSFHLRRISYRIAGGELQRQVTTSINTFPGAPPWTWPTATGPWVDVLGSVADGSGFSYYTAAGAQAAPPTPLPLPLADTSGLAAVGVTLAVSTGGANATRFTERDMIAIRASE